MSSASRLASTCNQLAACLSCLREGCPTYSQTIIISNLTPFTWRWELWCANHHLAPIEAGLVGSSLDVLSEGFWSWWDGLYLSAIVGEEMLASLVDMFLAAGSIVEQDNKMLQWIHVVIAK